MKIKVILLVITAIIPGIFSGLLFSQEAWNLEKCIAYALENNIRIRQQIIATNVSENNYRQSKTDIYPNLNASGSYGFSFGRALDQTTYQFTEDQVVQSSNMSLSSNVTLFSGFQKQNTIKQNYFDVQSSLKDLERLKNDISLNIAGAYLQILFNREYLEIAKSQLEITRQQVVRTNLLVEAGSLPKGSLLEIQAQEASEEVQVINAENQLNLSHLSLMQLLDLDVSKPFSIVVPQISSISEEGLLAGPDQVYVDALNILPQVKGSEFRLHSSEKSLDIMKGYRSPRLSLSASYGSGYSDIRQRIIGTESNIILIGQTAGGEDVFTTTNNPLFSSYSLFNQFKDNASTSLFLSMSIPIFNGRQISNNIKNANLAVINSRLELEYTRKGIYEEITRSHADAVAALKKYNSSEKAVAAMEESFKYTNERFELGLVNTVDFNIAKNQLLKVQSDQLQSKYDFIFKTNILNFYRGIPLKI